MVVPPLRDRVEDIETLATTFMRRALASEAAEVAPEIMSMLRSHRWPGNVRELKNVIDRHALMGVRDRKSLFDGEAPAGANVAHDLWSMPFHDARRTLLDDFERTCLTRALAASGGVVIRAAERAGIPRPTFYRMIDRLGMKPKDDSD